MLSGGDSALVSGLIMRTRPCSGPSIIDVPASQAIDFWRTAANHQSPQVTSEAKSAREIFVRKSEAYRNIISAPSPLQACRYIIKHTLARCSFQNINH
jgi:hypothetical protein